jgi:putative FmdB family regulatory protein
MPIYEYRCKSCGDVSEALQKVNDPPLRRCAKCSGSLEKLISRTSFQLKGGGWYAHGYGASKGSGTGDSGGGTKDSGTSTSKETKSSSKDSKSGSSEGEPRAAAGG